jgi:hypothetical protein
MNSIIAHAVHLFLMFALAVNAAPPSLSTQRGMLRSEGPAERMSEMDLHAVRHLQQHDKASASAKLRALEEKLMHQQGTFEADEQHLKIDLQKMKKINEMDLHSKVANIGRWLRDAQEAAADAWKASEKLKADEATLRRVTTQFEKQANDDASQLESVLIEKKAAEDALQAMRAAGTAVAATESSALVRRALESDGDEETEEDGVMATQANKKISAKRGNVEKKMAAEISGTGKFGVSLARERPGSILQNAVAPSDLLTLPLNGNFENGIPGELPQFWNQSFQGGGVPAHLSKDHHRNGIMSVKFRTNGFLVTGHQAEAAFEVDRGNKYELTFHALAPSTQGGVLTQFLVYSKSSDAAFRRALKTVRRQGSFQMYHDVPQSDGWQKFTHVFTADESSARVHLLLGCGTGPVWIDDVSFIQVCPEAICLTDSGGKEANFTGVYHKHHGGKHGQPVYKHESGQYLYYWAEFGSWLVGPDYRSSSSHMQSLNSGSSACPSPESGTSWSAWDGHKWVYPDIQVENC